MSAFPLAFSQTPSVVMTNSAAQLFPFSEVNSIEFEPQLLRSALLPDGATNRLRQMDLLHLGWLWPTRYRSSPSRLPLSRPWNIASKRKLALKIAPMPTEEI